MGYIICPYCEREIDFEAICPSCCGELVLKATIGFLAKYYCPVCDAFVYVTQQPKGVGLDRG